jgi:hypothetical protein
MFLSIPSSLAGWMWVLHKAEYLDRGCAIWYSCLGRISSSLEMTKKLQAALVCRGPPGDHFPSLLFPRPVITSVKGPWDTTLGFLGKTQSLAQGPCRRTLYG